MDPDEKHDLEDMRLLRLPEVIHLIGVSRSTFNQMRKDGRFPPGDQIGPRAVGWPRWVVEQWLKSRPPAAADVRRREGHPGP